MRTYVVKRLLLIPPTLVGITIISFLIMKMAPGKPTAVQALGDSLQQNALNAEAAHNWEEERHLNDPIYVQYWFWVRDLSTMNLQTFKRPRTNVWARIGDAVPYTIILNIISFLLVYTVAIPVGILCGVKQDRWIDRVLTIGVFILYSLPSFWVATLLLILFCDPMYLNWFPVTGVAEAQAARAGVLRWGVDWVWHLVLPITCLTYGGFAFLSRQMRGSLLEQIRQDYVRTARAKGLPERVVILKHAVRNSLIPIVTIFGYLLPAMVTGSVIIESIFSIPGMGWLFIEAIHAREYPILMTEVVLVGILTMLGILVSDLLYAVVNPTVSLEKAS